MKASSIQTRLLVFGMFMLAAGCLKSSEVAPRSSAAVDAKTAKLHQLRKDKVEVLQKIFNACENGFKRGEIDYMKLCDARRPLRRAQLEMCATDAERIGVLEKSLEEAKEIEGIAQAMEQGSGEMSKIDVHRARAECLDFEIELTRLK